MQVLYLLLAEGNVAPHELHVERRELGGWLGAVLMDVCDVLGQSG